MCLGPPRRSVSIPCSCPCFRLPVCRLPCLLDGLLCSVVCLYFCLFVCLFVSWLVCLLSGMLDWLASFWKCACDLLESLFSFWKFGLPLMGSWGRLSLSRSVPLLVFVGGKRMRVLSTAFASGPRLIACSYVCLFVR